LPIQLWIAIGGFVDFVGTARGKKYVDGGLKFRDTSIELMEESFAASSGWGDISQDWTFEFEFSDERIGALSAAFSRSLSVAARKRALQKAARAPRDEHVFSFWFVVAPKDRDLYNRYRPKDKSSWESHQRLTPIWSYRDPSTNVLVDVYDENPWEKQALKRKNPKEHKGCYAEISWWMAMRDFARWTRRAMKSSSLGGSIDYISSWTVPGTSESDRSNYFEIGEYAPGSPSAYHDVEFGTTNLQKLRLWYCWALKQPPSAYFVRATPGRGVRYKDPLWNSPNGELWIYDYDPWEVLAV
jgi:hypothetical protein